MQLISEKVSTLDENIQRHFLQLRNKNKPIVCQKLKFIYFDIPKCACTSLDHWIYQIEFNKKFKRYKKDNRWIYIHNCGEFNTISLPKLPEKKQQNYKIITVIRDPIKRLISAYSNRIIHHKELSENVPYRDKIQAAGLKFNPDINYFIENLESYQNCAKTISFHTRPITHFIGQDLSLYTNIYPIEEVNRIKEDVLVDSNPSLNTDSLPEIAKLQSGGPKLKLNVLKPESFDKLVAYYAKDYEILRNYYSLEKIKQEYISSIVDRGNELKEQGMLSEAIENYQKAIALQPERSTSVYTELGNTLVQNGQIEEAIALYQKAIEIVPENCRIYAKLAKLIMRQGNIEGAVIAYQKAITQASTQKTKQPAWFYNWVYSELGEALEKNGQIEEAIATYHKAIELNPNLISALLKLAEIQENQKEYAQAFTYYLKIVSLQPKKQVFFQNLVRVSENYSKLLLKKNDLDRAIAVYQEFLNHKLPRKANAERIDRICHNLGEVILRLSVRQGQFSRGITFFQEAIDKYPYKDWSYYHLGSILAKQDKFDEAIAYYERAVEIRPKFPLALLSLGELLLKTKRPNKAFQCGLKLLQSQENFTNARLNQIFIKLLLAHSNPKKSQAALQKVIEQIESSTSKPGLKATTYRSIGAILQWQDKILEAIDFYKKSTYHRLKALKPEYVERYWQHGKLQEPDFLIIGFGKCGTTAFYDYLCEHPQVLPAMNKETGYLHWLAKKNNYFDKQDWSLLGPEKDLYLAHFAPRPEGSHFVTGEASTTNFVPGVEKIISSWFPKVKLIALLREPVKRTISHYEQVLNMKIPQNRSLEEVINSELEELEATTNLSQTLVEKLRRNWKEHIAMSLYVYPLERWMNLFPREQFLILTNEDLAQYPKETMKQAFDFLGLPECDSIEYHPKHVGSYPQADPELLSRLSNFFRPHNQRLEEFLGRKFGWDDK